jgi:hypothetical protein
LNNIFKNPLANNQWVHPEVPPRAGLLLLFPALLFSPVPVQDGLHNLHRWRISASVLQKISVHSGFFGWLNGRQKKTVHRRMMQEV